MGGVGDGVMREEGGAGERQRACCVLGQLAMKRWLVGGDTRLVLMHHTCFTCHASTPSPGDMYQ